MNRTTKLVLGGLAMLLAALAIPRPAVQAQPSENAKDVVSIELPTVTTELPPGPNRDVAMACNLCHSARYILNQPPLTRKTWTAELDKMRKTFGAPITDTQAAQIIDYCVAVRGAKE